MIRFVGSGAEDYLSDLVVIEEESFHHPMTEAQLHALCRAGSTMWVLADAPEASDGRIVGSVWCQVVLDEGYIGNVAVRRDFRRQGIADSLLRALDTEAEEKNLRFLTLEVREGNRTAISLYKKHGYTPVGVRKNYYQNPRENALLMTKHFPGSKEFEERHKQNSHEDTGI